MAEIVRVARDGSAVVVSTPSGYKTVSADLDVSASFATLDDATKVGRWRRAVLADASRFAQQLEVANGEVVVTGPAAKSRTYRAPKDLQNHLKKVLTTSAADLTKPELERITRLANSARIDQDDVDWISNYFVSAERRDALRGGEAAKKWVKKITENPEALTASAFEFEPEFEYFGYGPTEGTTQVSGLIAVKREENVVLEWIGGEYSPLEESAEDLDRPTLIPLDEADALAVAAWIDNPETRENPDYIDVADLNPEERNIVDLAFAEMDWEEIDRTYAIIADASGYSPVERSQNAQRQIRTGDGKFGGDQLEKTDDLTVSAKARLGEGFELVTDPAALIQQYLSSVTTDAQEVAPEAAPVEETAPVVAAGSGGEVAPLYLAVVDPVDQTAVLDVVSIIPDEAGAASAWKRSGASWVTAPELLDSLQGATPPPVVHLQDEEQIKSVLAQVDQYDSGQPEAVAASAWELAPETVAGRKKAAKKGIALPDGSFPITDEEDLKNAVKAYGRAKDKVAAKRHIRKRARALNRTDLIPEEWKSASVFNDDHLTPLYGEFGEVIAMVAAGVPGVADAPSDLAAVERLRQYWSTGAGAAKIRWGTDGDLTRCHRNLAKYVGPERAWGYCQNLHKRIFGVSNATKDKD